MAEMILRDHSRPCKHPTRAWLTTETAEPASVWCCGIEPCPGGAVVEIDYEAAAFVLMGFDGRAGGLKATPTRTDLQMARNAVNAALGVVEP